MQASPSRHRSGKVTRHQAPLLAAQFMDVHNDQYLPGDDEDQSKQEYIASWQHDAKNQTLGLEEIVQDALQDGDILTQNLNDLVDQIDPNYIPSTNLDDVVDDLEVAPAREVLSTVVIGIEEPALAAAGVGNSPASVSDSDGSAGGGVPGLGQGDVASTLSVVRFIDVDGQRIPVKESDTRHDPRVDWRQIRPKEPEPVVNGLHVFGQATKQTRSQPDPRSQVHGHMNPVRDFEPILPMKSELHANHQYEMADSYQVWSLNDDKARDTWEGNKSIDLLETSNPGRVSPLYAEISQLDGLKRERTDVLQEDPLKQRGPEILGSPGTMESRTAPQGSPGTMESRTAPQGSPRTMGSRTAPQGSPGTMGSRNAPQGSPGSHRRVRVIVEDDDSSVLSGEFVTNLDEVRTTSDFAEAPEGTAGEGLQQGYTPGIDLSEFSEVPEGNNGEGQMKFNSEVHDHVTNQSRTQAGQKMEKYTGQVKPAVSRLSSKHLNEDIKRKLTQVFSGRQVQKASKGSKTPDVATVHPSLECVNEVKHPPSKLQVNEEVTKKLGEVFSARQTLPEDIAPDYPSSESGNITPTDAPIDKSPLKWAYHSTKKPQVTGSQGQTPKHKISLKSALKNPSKRGLFRKILPKPKEKAISFIDGDSNSSLCGKKRGTMEENSQVPYVTHLPRSNDSHSGSSNIHGAKKLRRTTIFDDSSSRSSYSHHGVETVMPLRLPRHDRYRYDTGSRKTALSSETESKWKPVGKIQLKQSGVKAKQTMDLSDSSDKEIFGAQGTTKKLGEVFSARQTLPEDIAPDYPYSDSGNITPTDAPINKSPLKWTYYSTKKPQVTGSQGQTTKHKISLKSQSPSKHAGTKYAGTKYAGTKDIAEQSSQGFVKQTLTKQTSAVFQVPNEAQQASFKPHSFGVFQQIHKEPHLKATSAAYQNPGRPLEQESRNTSVLPNDRLAQTGYKPTPTVFQVPNAQHGLELKNTSAVFQVATSQNEVDAAPPSQHDHQAGSESMSYSVWKTGHNKDADRASEGASKQTQPTTQYKPHSGQFHSLDTLDESISRTDPETSYRGDSGVKADSKTTGEPCHITSIRPEKVHKARSPVTDKVVTKTKLGRPEVMHNNGLMVDHATETTSDGIGCCGYILMAISGFLIFITLPFSLCLCIKVVQEYERAVIFRLGRLMSGGAKGPGLFFIIPCMDNYLKVDLRTVSFDVPPQEVLSKDSVTVAVDAVVYYRISNATISVTNVEDANRSTRLLAATTLRNVLGTKDLSQILSDRENISHMMQSSLDEATDPWGVKVERVEVKDVRLPVQLQRAMAAEAEAAREARAKVIAAEGEQKAARALKEAADIINESPAALQLRYLQTLNTISAEKNSTIVFPIPMDMMQGFMKK